MKLTDEQKKLIEDNHNLIYAFCYKQKLSIDEWYDVLALAMCERIRFYNPEKGKLSTFLFNIFLNKTRLEYRRKNTIKRGGHIDICSYDNLTDKSFPNTTYNHVEQAVVSKTLLEEMLTTEKQSDIDILTLRYKGYSQRKISEILNISQPQVSRRLKYLERKYSF